MKTPSDLIKTKWFAGIASLVLSMVSFTMFVYYSKLHWYLAFHWKDLSIISRKAVQNKMALLHCNWVIGFVALAVAIPSLKAGPRWLALIALAMAFLSILTAGVVQ